MLLCQAAGSTELQSEYSKRCNQVYYCTTTSHLTVTDIGEVSKHPNEAFKFALKDGELVVPQGLSVLGDGTQNYKLQSGFCQEDGKLPEQMNSFEAVMFLDKQVRFDDGILRGWDMKTNSAHVWWASCETLD